MIEAVPPSVGILIPMTSREYENTTLERQCLQGFLIVGSDAGSGVTP
jgi:hypothetical protein